MCKTTMYLIKNCKNSLSFLLVGFFLRKCQKKSQSAGESRLIFYNSEKRIFYKDLRLPEIDQNSTLRNHNPFVGGSSPSTANL